MNPTAATAAPVPCRSDLRVTSSMAVPSQGLCFAHLTTKRLQIRAVTPRSSRDRLATCSTEHRGGTEMSISGEPLASTLPGGIAFTGCAMMAAAAAADSDAHVHAHAGARRREVVVSGQRVKTIDVHAHCAVPAA